MKSKYAELGVTLASDSIARPEASIMMILRALTTFAVGTSLVFGAPKTKLNTPTITCAGSTQASINLQICAGQSGAPAGFSIQWMTAAQLAAGADGIIGTADDGAWFDSSAVGATSCGGSFSGNANLSRYELAPNSCVTVNIGEFLFDNGASTNCPGILACGTNYVFRGFAHATSSLNRSDFTPIATCSTDQCTNGGGCTFTQGYWKTHGPVPTGNNQNVWPVTSLTLGSVSYTDLQLQAIFNTPAGGNGLIALAHQLIAAKINIANGAAGASIAGAVADADALIGDLVIPPVGSGFLASSVTKGLTTALTAYNEGASGPGHCQE